MRKKTFPMQRLPSSDLDVVHLLVGRLRKPPAGSLSSSDSSKTFITGIITLHQARFDEM
jgi:hypothetical protein